MIFKKGELQHLWLFYLYPFIFGLSAMIAPYIILYFRELGFTFFEISLISSATAISMFVFEVPTGVMADGFSRKYSVVLGFFLAGLTVFMIPFATTFWQLVTLSAMLGFSMTFVSGAITAWVIDNLNHVKRKDLHKEYFIKNGSFMLVGFILAQVIGSFIVKAYGMKYIWFIYGAAFMINAGLLTVFGNEWMKPKRVKLNKTIQHSWKLTKKGTKIVFKNKTLLTLLIAGVFMGLQQVWVQKDGNRYLIEFGLVKEGLGIVYAIGALFLILAPFGTRLFKGMGVRKSVTIAISMQMVITLTLITLSPPQYIGAIIILIVAGMFPHMTLPLTAPYKHKHIPSKIRATTVSTISMVNKLLGTGVVLLGGYLLDLFGPQKVIAYSSLIGIAAIAVYWKLEE